MRNGDINELLSNKDEINNAINSVCFICNNRNN